MYDSDLETKTLGQPSVSAPFKTSSKLEDVQKSCHTYMHNAYVNGEKAEVTGEESGKPIIMSGEINVAVAEKAPNGGVGSMVQCLWPVFCLLAHLEINAFLSLCVCVFKKKTVL